MQIEGAWLTHPGTARVLKMLEKGGHKGLLVGGCVRDAIIGKPVGDIDIATDALPQRVMDLARIVGLRVVPTGIDHGTVTVIASGLDHEITTFRRDTETDGRHAVVEFSTDVREDARRRDFTMNALYADRSGNVFDPLGGLPDLLARRVRFIEDPAARIAEDHLRILRFFRFQAWYGDPAEGPDADALAACAEAAEGIESLSRERIGGEMLKLLAAPDPAPAVASMDQSGILARILPGAASGMLAVLVHLEDGVARPSPLRRLAMLGGEKAREALRLSRAQAARLDLLRRGMEQTAGVGELSYRYGEDVALDVALLRGASFGQPLSADVQRDIGRGATAAFPVRAADLMPEFQGPTLGKRLSQLESRWILSDFTLTREELLSA